MSEPKRIPRKRTKGWKMPPNAVYVGRPTRWGNPYSVAEYGRERAVRNYREHFWRDSKGWHFDAGPLDILQLRGKDLACWCPLDQPCHADVLLEIANSEETQ